MPGFYYFGKDPESKLKNMKNVKDYSSRSRRSFLKKAFATMAMGTAGTVVLPAAILEDDKRLYKSHEQSKSQDENLPERYRDKFRITGLDSLKRTSAQAQRQFVAFITFWIFEDIVSQPSAQPVLIDSAVDVAHILSIDSGLVIAFEQPPIGGDDIGIL